MIKEFKDFINLTETIKKIPLPGLEAQFNMAPKIRLKYSNSDIEKLNPKKAAIICLFYPNNNNELMLILIRRKVYNGTHSGQISFPGGKIEPNDKNLYDTALRECQEEIGVDRHKVVQIREITDVFIPPSNFLVTPFIGFSVEKPNFKIDDKEVEYSLEVNANSLFSQNKKSKVITTSYAKNIKVPVYDFNGEIIWGATAMILSEVEQILITAIKINEKL